VWFPERTESAALFMPFRNALSSLGGSPPLGNRCGLHRVSKGVQMASARAPRVRRHSSTAANDDRSVEVSHGAG